MKKVLYILTLLLFGSQVFAQTNNAIFFTENGERFQLILNGILQNATPETNVKMTQLNAEAYKVRVMFEDKKLGYVDYNMFFPSMGVEVTYNVKQNNKGNYVVRYISDVPVAQAPAPAPQQSVVVYHSTPAPAPTATTTTTVQQTQSTTSNGSGENVNINFGMNVNGSGGGISINASGLDGDGETVQSTTTTTTTHTVVTSSSSVSSAPSPAPVPAPVPVAVVYVPGYNGPVGCPIPMSPTDFNSMKETIRSKDFENTKLTIAKQVLNNNCLTASQVRDLLGLFDFENTRLDYAKYAYGHTYDIGNYYKVNDAFQFESSIDDLNGYINGR
jgi:hypothetical protein